MRYVLLIASLIVILAGCSFQSDYDKYMSEAKDAIIAKDYNKAIPIIELALVEEPTSKDATALLKSTKEKKEKKEKTDRLQSFLDASTPVYDKAVELYSSFNIDTITVEEAKGKLPIAKSLLPKLNDINSEFLYAEEFSESLTHLNYMVKGLEKAYEAIIENISDPVEVWDKAHVTRGERLTKLSESHDSKLRARGELLFFDTEADKFRSLQSMFKQQLYDLTNN